MWLKTYTYDRDCGWFRQHRLETGGVYFANVLAPVRHFGGGDNQRSVHPNHLNARI